MYFKSGCLAAVTSSIFLTGVVCGADKIFSGFVFDSCALKDIVIPSTVETILERAFGDMPTLETVTFKKRLDEDGNIIVPNINEKAFAGSGSTDHTLTFNLPWSSDKTPLAPWGATNCELNFDYNEGE